MIGKIIVSLLSKLCLVMIMPLTKKRTEPVNLLIMSPSPRNILWFNEKLDLLNQKYDILRVKNEYVEKDAYNKGRDFFLEHNEYTHMAILPDDLLVNVSHVDKLIQDIMKYDYQVISGICNFAYSTKKFFNNMSAIEFRNSNAVQDLSRTDKYNYFRDIMSRTKYKELKQSMANKQDKIIRVAMSAFPFMIIRRDVLEQIKFDANPMGVDTVWCGECIRKNIGMYVDLDVELLHLKGMEKNAEMFTYDKNKNLVSLARVSWENNIVTSVNYSPANPPPKEIIFLPKKIK